MGEAVEVGSAAVRGCDEDQDQHQENGHLAGSDKRVFGELRRHDGEHCQTDEEAGEIDVNGHASNPWRSAVPVDREQRNGEIDEEFHDDHRVDGTRLDA